MKLATWAMLLMLVRVPQTTCPWLLLLQSYPQQPAECVHYNTPTLNDTMRCQASSHGLTCPKWGGTHTIQVLQWGAQNWLDMGYGMVGFPWRVLRQGTRVNNEYRHYTPRLFKHIYYQWSQWKNNAEVPHHMGQWVTMQHTFTTARLVAGKAQVTKKLQWKKKR